MKLNNKSNQKLSVWAKGGLTVVISVLIISVVVKAGSLTPTSSPAATSYTLTDIYNRLNDSTPATEGDHDFAPGASPAGTLYTLKQIYDEIPTIVANTVKSGTSYLGVDGTLVPSNGASESLTATDALCGQEYFGLDASSWTPSAGTICTGLCQTCSEGSCGNANNLTDEYSQCGGSSCCGYCDGDGECAYVADGSTCTTPGDSCDGDYTCNGTGGCELWSCGDNLTFTYDEEEVTYDTVEVDYGGGDVKCWMDRNLGASQVATAYNDSAAYGDLFQWGRLADGHQDRASGTTFESSSTDNPGHSNFILGSSPLYDWRDSQNDNLWQGASGINNPCPSGWRIPTETELNTERLSWGSYDSAGAIASPLKLVVANIRSYSSGAIFFGYGLYWSSTIDDANALSLYFTGSNASMDSNYRAQGFSVRCIKD